MKLMKSKTQAIPYILQKMYSQNDDWPCKKALQKIVYLIEEKNIHLGFDYGIHFYGPYSAELDSTVLTLINDEIVHISQEGLSHKICLIDKTETDKRELSQSERDAIDNVIDLFGRETPFVLELITTSHFVAQQRKITNTDQIIHEVKRIKGSKYSDLEIAEAITALKNASYFS